MGIDKPPKKKSPVKRLFGAALGAFALGTATTELLAPRTGAPEQSRQFSARDQAERELREEGITRYQRGAYRQGNERIAQSLSAFGYRGGGSDDLITGAAYAVVGSFVNLIDMQEQELREKQARASDPREKAMYENTIRTNGYRTDAFRMYLGLPQLNDTFTISRFRPENSRDDTYYYALTGFSEDGYANLRSFLPNELREDRLVPYLLRVIEEKKRGETSYAVASDYLTFVMRNFTLSSGVDEQGRHYISYYDRWDLDQSIERSDGWRGQPFEIYDRIYYDPNTFELIGI